MCSIVLKTVLCHYRMEVEIGVQSVVVMDTVFVTIFIIVYYMSDLFCFFLLCLHELC